MQPQRDFIATFQFRKKLIAFGRFTAASKCEVSITLQYGPYTFTKYDKMYGIVWNCIPENDFEIRTCNSEATHTCISSSHILYILYVVCTLYCIIYISMYCIQCIHSEHLQLVWSKLKSLRANHNFIFERIFFISVKWKLDWIEILLLFEYIIFLR